MGAGSIESVILDLTLDLIDNLLIVSPPKRNEEIEQTRDGMEVTL